MQTEGDDVDLMARLHQLRPSWRFPEDSKRTGIACEICSDHTKDDSTPVWSGREIYADGTTGAIWAESNDTEQLEIFKALAKKRKNANATTHWDIARRANDEMPLLFKITANSQNNTNVQRFDFFDWNWASETDVGRVNELVRLHHKVLWASLLEKGKKQRISIVYCHKAGTLVFGIWAFHASGDGWVNTIEKVAQPNEINRLIWPASILLLQTAAIDLVDLRMVRRDLSFLVANCLRENDTVILEKEFDRKVQGGELTSKLKTAEKIFSGCNDAVGRIFHYECAFAILLEEIIRKNRTDPLPETLEATKEQLGRLFASWHHVARSRQRQASEHHFQFKNELATTSRFFDAEDENLRMDECSAHYWCEHVLPIIDSAGLFKDQENILNAVKRMFFLGRVPTWLNDEPESHSSDDAPSGEKPKDPPTDNQG